MTRTNTFPANNSYGRGTDNHMTCTESGRMSDQRTAALQADHIAELHAPTSPGDQAPLGLEKLAIGAAMLVVKRGRNVVSRHMLDGPCTSVGRHPGSDVFLDDITVSRRHAEFRCETGEFSIVDTGSLNGTYVNRQPMDFAVLANGDEIQIGNTRLMFITGPTTQEAV
jgi:pSer/pThr/pTyr-binding forkhead associated (FHA) protein